MVKKRISIHFNFLHKVVWLCVAFCCLLSMPIHAVTLEDEFKSLLENHPLLSSQQQKIAASKDNLRASQSVYLPTINLSGSAGKEYVNPAGAGSSSSLSNKSASINIEQNLFSGYADEARTHIASLDSSIQSVIYKQVKQNLILSAVESYLGVIRQRKLLKMAKQNESNIEQLLVLEEERYKHGASLIADILHAKTRLQHARERRSYYQNSLDNAVSNYIGIFNHKPDINELQDVEIPEHVMPQALSDALVSAGGFNPGLKSFQLEIDKARQQIRVEKSSYAPSVNLIGSSNWQQDDSGISGVRKDSSVMLEFTWNLFDGKKTSSKVSAAGKQLAALNDDYTQLLRQTEESVRLHWGDFQNGKQRLAYLKDAVTVAAELYDNRQQLRAAGQNTAQNVLDARSEYFSAQISKISADYDTRIAAFKLLRSCGTIGLEAIKNSDKITKKNIESMPVDSGSIVEKALPPTDKAVVQSADNFVIQLMAMRNLKLLENFIEKNHLQEKASIYTLDYQGSDLHLLVYGNYDSQDAASQSIATLSDNLKKLKPWVRKLNMAKREAKLMVTEGAEKIAESDLEHANPDSGSSTDTSLSVRDKILKRSSSGFVLQLMSMRDRISLENFIAENYLQDEATIYTVEYQGNDLHVMIYGNYENINEAKQSIASLPGKLRGLKPWVRELSMVQNEIRIGRK